MNLSTQLCQSILQTDGFFNNSFASHPLEPRHINTVELKDPRPALIGNGASGKRRRPHGHTPSGEGNGSTGKKIMVEREMDG